MHILSVESRQTTLADRQPMSKGELLRYFGGLKTEKVPEASGTLYSTVQDYFSAHPFLVNKKYLRFDVNGIFSLQGQYVYGRENEIRFDSFRKNRRLYYDVACKPVWTGYDGRFFAICINTA